MNFSCGSTGKIGYIPRKEADDEAWRMRDEGYQRARAYECWHESKKGTVHWHVTSGRTREEKRLEREEAELTREDDDEMSDDAMEWEGN